MTPAEECLNRDGGLALPGCWMAVLRRLESGASSGQPPTSRDIHVVMLFTTCMAIKTAGVYALKMTRVSSRNVGKVSFPN